MEVRHYRLSSSFMVWLPVFELTSITPARQKRLLWLSGVLLSVLFSDLIAAEAKVKNDLILEMGTPCSAQPGWERLWAGPPISPILIDLAGMPVFETTRLLHHCPHLGIVFQLFAEEDRWLASSLAALSWLSQLALTLETCAKVGQLLALQGATVWLGGAPGAPWNAHAVRCCWLFCFISNISVWEDAFNWVFAISAPRAEVVSYILRL